MRSNGQSSRCLEDLRYPASRSQLLIPVKRTAEFNQGRGGVLRIGILFGTFCTKRTHNFEKLMYKLPVSQHAFDSRSQLLLPKGPVCNKCSAMCCKHAILNPKSYTQTLFAKGSLDQSRARQVALTPCEDFQHGAEPRRI